MINGTKWKRLTANGLIKTGQGKLIGMYVASTTVGTAKIYNGTDNTGAVMNDTITPAVGYHNLGGAAFDKGLYVEVGGTASITFYYL